MYSLNQVIKHKFSKSVLHFLIFQIGFVTGVFLAVVLGVSFSSLGPVFTKDTQVLGIVRTGVLVSFIIC